MQVDAFASAAALTINSQHEFERNTEGYQFLKWGQTALNNFRVVPPATGIVHQVNLEYLAQVRAGESTDGLALPRALVGTDSHTTMINGLGVVGGRRRHRGRSGDARAQPILHADPEVVGFKLTGKLPRAAPPPISFSPSRRCSASTAW